MHRKKPETVNILGQNGFDLSDKSAIAADDSPTPKKAIKLEDKLISGEEIEFYPDFRMDSQHTECAFEKTAAHLTNGNSRQSESEFSKFYLTLNSRKPDESDRPTNKSPIIAEDYPKLYVTATNASEKDTMSKSSLLKGIRGIQHADGDSYGINISNSRFFVPKDYIFSGMECAMDDLKFEVDPEMGKLLQRSYSTPLMGTRSILVDVETSPSSSDNTTADTLTVPKDSRMQREDSRHVKTLSDTSAVILRPKESDTVEHRQRLFLKKRDSKPSCEVIDFLLNEKSNTSTALQSGNRAELLDSVHKNEEKSSEAKTESHKNSPTLKSAHLKDGTATQKILSNNQLWTAKQVIIDDNEITIKPASDANGDNFDGVEESKKPDLSNEHTDIDTKSTRLTENTNTRCEEKPNPSDMPNVILTKRKSYPLSTEASSQSECPSSVTPPRTPSRILSEQDNLQRGASKDDTRNGETAPSESESRATNAISQSQSAADSETACKDQSAPMGRTSSLREKFETIVEDVEFRTAPGRRLQIGKPCDRKSLS